MIVALSLHRFYVSHHPVGTPLIVVRNRSVLDVNSSAYASGVRTGMAISTAKSVLSRNPEQVSSTIVEWRRETYESSQHAWLNRCVPFTDVIEPVDQHLCFLDLSLHPDPDTLLASLQEAFRGTDYHMGLGQCRWMAEASLLTSDKEGLAYYAPLAFLDELPISMISTISTACRKRLEFLGYRTAGELHRISATVLREQFGEEATAIIAAAKGRGGGAVEALYPFGSIAARRYFEEGIESTQGIEQALQVISKELAENLSSKDLVSHRLVLRLELEDRVCTRQRIFSKALQNARSIYSASSMLANVQEPVYGIRIQLLELKKNVNRQTSLYTTRTNSIDTLKGSIHNVQRQFGSQSIQVAGEIPLTRRQKLLKAWRDATGWR